MGIDTGKRLHTHTTPLRILPRPCACARTHLHKQARRPGRALCVAFFLPCRHKQVAPRRRLRG